jgi:tetratricopeptide (TPR) repeat protein/tRNA A-37 threonylcarbamoyl transferase component Bud32
MGVVYEARQISLKRRVALKVLPPAIGLTQQARQRFEREAQAAAKLHHTNIVPVHAIGEDDSHHFYAMELIEGQSLDQVLRQLVDEGANTLLAETVTKAASELPQQPLPPAESKPVTSSVEDSTTSLGDTSAGSRPWFDAVAKLIAEVADALDYAHGRGVIHRDIKPANLMLSGEGKLCITDFGLARIAQEPGMTVSGSFLGTPAYMSPEQIAAGRVKLDHRTDVYSLGAVMYELLTLQRPFVGESREEVLSAIMAKDPRSPRKLNGKIPQDLETICLKALEKDPDRRYATAAEFAEDLRQYLQHGLIAAKRAGLLRRTGKSIRRHPVAAMAVLAVVLVAGVGTVAWQQMSGRRSSDVERMVSDARLLLIQGEQTEALERAGEVLAADPGNHAARLIRARVLLYRTEHSWDILKEARAVLAEDPNNWEAHVLVAATAKYRRLYSVPIDEHLDAVERLAPESADASYLRALTLGGDKSREALALFDRALELDPGHVLALEERSDTYAKLLKDLPLALADAERIIAVRPRSALGFQQKSYVLEVFHDTAQALEMVNKALDLDPEFVRAYKIREWINRRRGQYKEGLRDATRAAELEGAWHIRAYAYSKLGEYDLAIADYRRAIELNPDNLSAYSGLFWTHWDAGQRDEARAALGELEARAKSWIDEAGLCEYKQELASAYSALGKHDRALAAAERAVELRPNEVRTHSRLVFVRRKAEGQVAIVGDCDRLAALELDEPSELNDRANAMRDLCYRTDQALADYGQAIELAPSWADPYHERALLYEVEENLDRAVADIEKAVELAPSWTKANVALARLRTRIAEGVDGD